MFVLERMGGGSEARSNAEDSRSAFDELSSPVGVRRFDSCPPHHQLPCSVVHFLCENCCLLGLFFQGLKVESNISFI